MSGTNYAARDERVTIAGSKLSRPFAASMGTTRTQNLIIAAIAALSSAQAFMASHKRAKQDFRVTQ